MVSSSTVDSLGVGSLFAERYELLSVLGQGAMGKVFLARDTILGGTKVALKILNASLCQDEASLQRFMREVQLTREISHPNVVRTFDVGALGELPYFTMEYVEGSTLEQAIKKNQLGIKRSIQILKEIAQALTAIHDKNVIHRDLKPSNIILTEDSGIKLMDFGVARPQFSKLTASDELVGSATHMAPEIWKQSETTKKVDIYGLGVIAYEMLSGVLPFDGSSAYEIMWKHLRHSFIPLQEIEPKVPRWLATLVNTMLEKEPCDRPESAQEIVRLLDLQEMSKGQPVSPVEASIKTESPSTHALLRPFSTMLTRRAPHSVTKPKPRQISSAKRSKNSYLNKRDNSKAKLITTVLILLVLAAIVLWVISGRNSF